MSGTIAISASKGRMANNICCLDADDMLRPDYFEKALFYLETYHCDVVHPGLHFFGDFDELSLPIPTTLLSNLERNKIATVSVFRKQAWKKIGGYRDWPLGPNYVYEDWEFWVRMFGYGFRF